MASTDLGRVARALDLVELSTPCRWRGERLGHHGRGVFSRFCVLWLLSHGLKKMVQNNFKDKVNGVTLCPTLACTAL